MIRWAAADLLPLRSIMVSVPWAKVFWLFYLAAQLHLLQPMLQMKQNH